MHEVVLHRQCFCNFVLINMKALFKRYIFTFVTGIVVFALGKLLFLALNGSVYQGISCGDIFRILYHGLSMDCTVAAYVAVLPALASCVALWVGSKRVIDTLMRIYFAVVAVALSLCIGLDAALYGYWQFKLDVTPFSYFLSSPSAAFASAVWWQIVLGMVGWIGMAAVIYWLYVWSVLKLGGTIVKMHPLRRRIWSTVAGVLLAGLLFVPIRGGFTVSTMNLSRAYFSADTKMNHAAVNPAFSLLYSATHQSNFGTMYRFFSEDEAQRLFDELRDAPMSDDVPRLLSVNRPNVHIILLESFSSHLLPVLGGEPIALGLDSIARSGALWTNFYASSFRTDRGIPAVLSGYPGQPTTSVMKYVSKAEHLPSLPRSMVKKGGYEATYYYGGDANFTNQLAYLVASGFHRVVSDKDFPMSQRLSKWGAHDDVVFARVIEELTPYDATKPKLTVIQTSSSHEPFEVPYSSHGRLADKRAEAFAYADSCVTAYINVLAARPDWANTLVVLVPDHYGAYPDLTDPVERHRIPLIMTGGALAFNGEQSTVGSQTDIAATLLDALSLDHSDFPFSNNLLNPRSPHFAFFADPSYIGMITADNILVYSLDSNTPIMDEGADPGSNLNYAKAFLQTLYTDLQSR